MRIRKLRCIHGSDVVRVTWAKKHAHPDTYAVVCNGCEREGLLMLANARTPQPVTDAVFKSGTMLKSDERSVRLVDKPRPARRKRPVR